MNVLHASCVPAGLLGTSGVWEASQVLNGPEGGPQFLKSGNRSVRSQSSALSLLFSSLLSGVGAPFGRVPTSRSGLEFEI